MASCLIFLILLGQATPGSGEPEKTPSVKQTDVAGRFSPRKVDAVGRLSPKIFDQQQQTPRNTAKAASESDEIPDALNLDPAPAEEATKLELGQKNAAPRNTKSADSKEILVGTLVEIVGGQTHPPCLVALQESGLDQIREANQIVGALFTTTVEDSESAAPEFFPVKLSQEARVLQIVGSNLEVEVMNGPWARRSGWVPQEHCRIKPSERSLYSDKVDDIPLTKRRTIYGDLCRAMSKANQDAENSFPTEARHFSWSSEEVARRVGLTNRIFNQIYSRERDKVLLKHRVKLPQIEKIQEEGIRERWPVPELKPRI